MERKIYVGSNYNPEHWPKDRWPIDVQYMKEAGVNVLRLTDLAWSRLEPEDGKFDFGWLDEFMAMAGEAGIGLILTTPIEASPVWLRHKHPEVVRTDKFGRIHGERGNHCHNRTALHFYVERLVDRMASRYARHPAVIGWQIDNELRAVHCYCEECLIGFQAWLRSRYGTLERLNDEWGTVFWSQEYRSWDEVKLPSADQLTISVSQVVDYYRFASDSTVNHVARQADIIKGYAPHHFVTHNSLGYWYLFLDLNRLAEKLDFMGWDSYPDVDSDNHHICIGHDLHRSVKPSNDKFWVLEQKNGYFNYSNYNLAIEPGLVRLWAYQDIARGANGVLFYNWRSNRFSWEQNPNGIFRHDGTPRRAYYEMKQMIAELGGFGGELVDASVEAPVAIIHSYDQIWGYEAHKQYTNFDYRRHIMDYHKVLARNGVTADLVEPQADLSRYKLVIAPSMAMVNEDIQRNLEAYVKNGGCLVIGARSGMKTWANTTIVTPWPGLLTELAGVAIDEFEVLPDHYSNGIAYKGKEYRVKVWLDMLETKTAETVATYTEKFYAGRTAISKNRFGEGTVYYVGVMGSTELIEHLLNDIAGERGIRMAPIPDEIYVTHRVNKEHRFTFFINVNRKPVTVKLDYPGLDVIKGEEVTGEAEIGGLDVLIIKSAVSAQQEDNEA
ncbi:beta-galactosidase [Paenibacillus arenilitoris]|uniref:Beta-galactosidase n=1 Tax=Paenibacillus arenilitoris TaxID=2772299 RepID=A0A927CQH1_9BACL|nr:beta-galactosidase [Paenibacillus arenilitoris]MBD2870938.1 beta-galactosidase [Paenibacillus arenilitoris]